MATQRLISFRLTGLSPLLMHRDDVDSADELSKWRKDPTNKSMSVAGDDRYPPWTWAAYLLHDADNLVMPHEYIAACVCKAAASVVRSKQKTFKDIIGSSFLQQGESCEFLVGGKPVPYTPLMTLSLEKDFQKQREKATKYGFELKVQRLRVGTSKHVRVWPCFPQWEVRGVAELRDDSLTADVMASIFNVAGKIGLGDRRPGSPKAPGRFGVFAASVEDGKASRAA